MQHDPNPVFKWERPEAGSTCGQLPIVSGGLQVLPKPRLIFKKLVNTSSGFPRHGPAEVLQTKRKWLDIMNGRAQCHPDATILKIACNME